MTANALGLYTGATSMGGTIIRSDVAGVVEPIIFSCDIGSVEILAGFIPANFLVTNPFLLCVTPWDIPGTTIHLRFLLG